MRLINPEEVGDRDMSDMRHPEEDTQTRATEEKLQELIYWYQREQQVKDVYDEWATLALVVDRWLFMVYLVSISISWIVMTRQ